MTCTEKQSQNKSLHDSSSVHNTLEKVWLSTFFSCQRIEV